MSRKQRPSWAVNEKPPDFIRTVPIVTIRPNEEPHVIVLSHELFGLNCHWTGKRTEPCTKGNSKCFHCEQERPKRWKGWICVASQATRKLSFIELTVGGANGLLEQLGELPLRGAVIRLKRERPSIKAPLVVVYLSHWPRPDELPKPADPVETLSRLWGSRN